MDIKQILDKAENTYEVITGNTVRTPCVNIIQGEIWHWEDIESSDERCRRIYSLAKQVNARLPYFVPLEIMPYVCSMGTGNYADPKYYRYTTSEMDSWNENFFYIRVPGALPFVITEFMSHDIDHLYEQVKYVVPLCVGTMGVWKWQEQKDVSWLPKDKNNEDTIWAVIGYCVDKYNKSENGDCDDNPYDEYGEEE